MGKRKPDDSMDHFDVGDLLRAQVVSASIFLDHADEVRTCIIAVSLNLARHTVTVTPVSMCADGPTTDEVAEAVAKAANGPIGIAALIYLDRFVSPISLTPPAVRKLKDTTGWSSPSHALAAIYVAAGSLCDAEWEAYGGNPGWE